LSSGDGPVAVESGPGDAGSEVALRRGSWGCFVKAENDIVEALRALAGADGAVEASPELEARVTRAFRVRQARRKWNRAAAWTIAAAAAVAIAMFMVRQPRPVVQQATYQSPRAAVPAEPGAPARIAEPARIRHARTRQPREIVTDFFPLIEAPPPLDHGELFRVTVSAAAMRTVGLPVPEDRLTDRVQADVLVSEDGLATAIRFVKNE
jgi:hypothetical protein